MDSLVHDENDGKKFSSVPQCGGKLHIDFSVVATL